MHSNLHECTSLSAWFAGPKGAYVLDWEQRQIDSAVEDTFGFNAVQIGLPQIDFLRSNRIPLRICTDEALGAELCCMPCALPLASQSVDLILLPHVLEFSDSPHQILREAERVLRPEGQIVIAGFNPLSLWGLKRMLRHRSGRYPWCGDFIGLLRLRDWLKLLGFELNGGRFGCYAPPFRSHQWLQRFAFMEQAGDRWWPIAGGIYVVRAVKRVHGMRLLTPCWKSSKARVKALAPIAREQGEMQRVLSGEERDA